MENTENDIFDYLMSNTDFRDWVYDPTLERNQFWQKWMQASDMHRKQAEKARETILSMKFKEEHLEDTEIDLMLSNIIDATKGDMDLPPAESPLPKLRKRNWLMIAASAIFFLVSLVFVSIQNSDFPTDSIQTKKLSNPSGRRSKIKLPDGSLVILNASSSISFPEKFADNKRVVTLSGEAFFDVKESRDKPFIVKTSNVQTLVLGTEFNVRSFDGEQKVNIALKSGKVEITNPSNADMIFDLKPGQMVAIDNHLETYDITHFDYETEFGWKDNVLVFNNADFETFVRRLERWYGVDIEVKDAPDSDWKVNGRFEKKESLNEILMGVKFTYGLNFSIEDKKVILSSE